MLDVIPALYKGQLIKFDAHLLVAWIKVWNGSDWVWAEVPITSKRQRHRDRLNQVSLSGDFARSIVTWQCHSASFRPSGNTDGGVCCRRWD